jgi:hypothetical protein
VRHEPDRPQLESFSTDARAEGEFFSVFNEKSDRREKPGRQGKAG